MNLMGMLIQHLASPFGEGGLRGIPATSASATRLKSPLPPFSKGGDHPNTNRQTTWHAEERP